METSSDITGRTSATLWSCCQALHLDQCLQSERIACHTTDDATGVVPGQSRLHLAQLFLRHPRQLHDRHTLSVSRSPFPACRLIRTPGLQMITTLAQPLIATPALPLDCHSRPANGSPLPAH